MIQLQHVYKSYRTLEGRKVVLRDANFTIGAGSSIGILGANGTGKSTLMRMLAGVELPDRGRILRRGRVSFPLGFGGTFHDHLSGAENVRFLARVYGADSYRALRFVQDFAELGNYMRMPVRTYSSGMRAKLAFGTCLAIDFDVYLIDEVTAVGDARFQERCRSAFEERMATADVLMVSHSFSTMRSYCDGGGWLHDGTLQIYADLEDAIAAHSIAMHRGPLEVEPS